MSIFIDTGINQIWLLEVPHRLLIQTSRLPHSCTSFRPVFCCTNCFYWLIRRVCPNREDRWEDRWEFKHQGSEIQLNKEKVYTRFLSAKNKRKIKATQFQNSVSSNIVKKYVNNNNYGFKVKNGRTAEYINSFFIKAVQDWNYLSDSVVCTETVGGF